MIETIAPVFIYYSLTVGRHPKSPTTFPNVKSLGKSVTTSIKVECHLGFSTMMSLLPSNMYISDITTKIYYDSLNNSVQMYLKVLCNVFSFFLFVRGVHDSILFMFQNDYCNLKKKRIYKLIIPNREQQDVLGASLIWCLLFFWKSFKGYCSQTVCTFTLLWQRFKIHKHAHRSCRWDMEATSR